MSMAMFAQVKELEARVATLEKLVTDLLALNQKTLKLPVEKNVRLSA